MEALYYSVYRAFRILICDVLSGFIGISNTNLVCRHFPALVWKLGAFIV